MNVPRKFCRFENLRTVNVHKNIGAIICCKNLESNFLVRQLHLMKENYTPNTRDKYVVDLVQG